MLETASKGGGIAKGYLRGTKEGVRLLRQQTEGVMENCDGHAHQTHPHAPRGCGSSAGDRLHPTAIRAFLEPTMVDFVVLASVVFAFGLVSRRLEGTILTAPIVFVAAGMVLGPAGLGLVEFGLDDHTVLLLGEIALALVLFTDAARINLSALRQNEAIAPAPSRHRDAAHHRAGDPAAALLLTDLSFWEAAIVGYRPSPTDAALGQAVVSNPRVPARVRQALNVEAGLNDGLSVPFLALFLILARPKRSTCPQTSGYASPWSR